MSDDDQGFSHHCPKCNHHNPTMCVMAGQLKALQSRLAAAEAVVKQAERDHRNVDCDPEACEMCHALDKYDAATQPQSGDAGGRNGE